MLSPAAASRNSTPACNPGQFPAREPAVPTDRRPVFEPVRPPGGVDEPQGTYPGAGTGGHERDLAGRSSGRHRGGRAGGQDAELRRVRGVERPQLLPGHAHDVVPVAVAGHPAGATLHRAVALQLRGVAQTEVVTQLVCQNRRGRCPGRRAGRPTRGSYRPRRARRRSRRRSTARTRRGAALARGPSPAWAAAWSHNAYGSEQSAAAWNQSKDALTPNRTAPSVCSAQNAATGPSIAAATSRRGPSVPCSPRRESHHHSDLVIGAGHGVRERRIGGRSGEHVSGEDLARRLQAGPGRRAVGDLPADDCRDGGADLDVRDRLGRDAHGLPVHRVDPAEQSVVGVGGRRRRVLRPRLDQLADDRIDRCRIVGCRRDRTQTEPHIPRPRRPRRAGDGTSEGRARITPGTGTGVLKTSARRLGDQAEQAVPEDGAGLSGATPATGASTGRRAATRRPVRFRPAGARGRHLWRWWCRRPRPATGRHARCAGPDRAAAPRRPQRFGPAGRRPERRTRAGRRRAGRRRAPSKRRREQESPSRQAASG